MVVASDAPSEMVVPVWFPCVTVAVGDFSSRLDVSIPDANGLDELARRVSDNPTAAVVLAQVLRAGGTTSLEHDLSVESLAYSTLQAGAEHQSWLRSRTRRDRQDPGPPVEIERDGHELRVRLNRPGVRNAFSAAMRDALCEALALACSDPTIASLRLSGAGPDFCSGGDLDEFGLQPDPAKNHALRVTRNAARLMSLVGDRVTAELHGSCIGAGIELAAFARRVVAVQGTRISLPEVGMGLIPGAGGTASIPRRVGRQRTAWLALSGAEIDARTAFDWGLVDEVVG
jgi:enoyl-CoA hydratase/carnithine racemase